MRDGRLAAKDSLQYPGVFGPHDDWKVKNQKIVKTKLDSFLSESVSPWVCFGKKFFPPNKLGQYSTVYEKVEKGNRKEGKSKRESWLCNCHSEWNQWNEKWMIKSLN